MTAKAMFGQCPVRPLQATVAPHMCKRGLRENKKEQKKLKRFLAEAVLPKIDQKNTKLMDRWIFGKE